MAEARWDSAQTRKISELIKDIRGSYRPATRRLGVGCETGSYRPAPGAPSLSTRRSNDDAHLRRELSRMRMRWERWVRRIAGTCCGCG